MDGTEGCDVSVSPEKSPGLEEEHVNSAIKIEADRNADADQDLGLFITDTSLEDNDNVISQTSLEREQKVFAEENAEHISERSSPPKIKIAILQIAGSIPVPLGAEDDNTTAEGIDFVSRGQFATNCVPSKSGGQHQKPRRRSKKTSSSRREQSATLSSQIKCSLQVHGQEVKLKRTSRTTENKKSKFSNNEVTMSCQRRSGTGRLLESKRRKKIRRTFQISIIEKQQRKHLVILLPRCDNHILSSPGEGILHEYCKDELNFATYTRDTTTPHTRMRQNPTKSHKFTNKQDASESGASDNKTKKRIGSWKNRSKSQRKFFCPDCGKCFTKVENFTNHRNSLGEAVDDDSKLDSIPCCVCDLKFPGYSCLDHHTRMHFKNGDNKNKVTCKFCGSSFSRAFALTTHYKVVHLRVKAYACSDCGAKFSLAHDLRSHKLEHERTEQDQCFVCSICGKEFMDATQLRIHEESVHVDRKEYSCPVCGGSFNRMDFINEHIRSHMNATERREYDLSQSDRKPYQIPLSDSPSHPELRACLKGTEMEVDEYSVEKLQVENKVNHSNVESKKDLEGIEDFPHSSPLIVGSGDTSNDEIEYSAPSPRSPSPVAHDYHDDDYDDIGIENTGSTLDTTTDRDRQPSPVFDTSTVLDSTPKLKYARVVIHNLSVRDISRLKQQLKAETETKCFSECLENGRADIASDNSDKKYAGNHTGSDFNVSTNFSVDLNSMYNLRKRKTLGSRRSKPLTDRLSDVVNFSENIELTNAERERFQEREMNEVEDPEWKVEEPTVRNRGRPRKYPVVNMDRNEGPKVVRGRGRPRKYSKVDPSMKIPKKIGRPKKGRTREELEEIKERYYYRRRMKRLTLRGRDPVDYSTFLKRRRKRTEKKSEEAKKSDDANVCRIRYATFTRILRSPLPYDTFLEAHRKHVVTCSVDLLNKSELKNVLSASIESSIEKTRPSVGKGTFENPCWTFIGNELRCICPACGETFMEIGELLTHKKSFHDSIQFCCVICSRPGPSSNHLSSHYNLDERASNARSVICHICGKPLTNRSYMAHHLVTHMSYDERVKYWKDIEDKTGKIPPKVRLNRPMTGSKQRTKYRNRKRRRKEFLRMPEDLKFQIISARTNQAAICSTCGMVFKTKYILQTHERAKHGSGEENGFNCPICGRPFERKHYIYKHIPSHLNADEKTVFEKWTGSREDFFERIQTVNDLNEMLEIPPPKYRGRRKKPNFSINKIQKCSRKPGRPRKTPISSSEREHSEDNCGTNYQEKIRPVEKVDFHQSSESQCKPNDVTNFAYGSSAMPPNINQQCQQTANQYQLGTYY